MTDILQLRSLRPLSVTEQDGAYIIEAEGKLSLAKCPHCYVGKLHLHGRHVQSFRDTPSHGRCVRISVNRRRYRCQSCGKTLFDPIPDLDNKRLATTRLINHIRARCFRETFASIARQVDMDEKSIRQVFADFVGELEATIRFVTPRFLGIDELKIVGAYRAMITNVERKTIFDMHESRSKAALLPYFRGLRDKEKVEWVAMDMYHVYRQVIRATLPHARIVVDKFHIQRMANEVLEKMRKRFRKTLTERQRLRLKDERFLLLKRQQDLSDETMRRLLAWFKQFPLLGEAHALKEGFLSIWDHSTRSSAEKAYQRWETNILPELRVDFRELITALTNWHEEIFSYFENPITNAYTESANSLAKSMNRMGRGYSFELIRARMLYDARARKDGAVVEDPPSTYALMQRMATGAHTPGTARRFVEYGPYIPTLTRLLDEGHFEKPILQSRPATCRLFATANRNEMLHGPPPPRLKPTTQPSRLIPTSRSYIEKATPLSASTSRPPRYSRPLLPYLTKQTSSAFSVSPL